MLRPRLARPRRELRLLDVARQEPAGPGETLIEGDLTDAETLARAVANVDAVLHLAAYPVERSWADLQRLNVDGTRAVLDAARDAGVSRVVLASTIHAAGFYPRTEALPATAPARPDTYYGWSKAAVESLGSLYADRFGMSVFALRLGACFAEPLGDLLDLWLSPDDCARLVEACLTTDHTGYRVVWGISRNTRRWLSLAEGEEIGYHPLDDAEAYAASLDPVDGERLGGFFCEHPLGEPL
ncbi:NAD(P)-dependent oxidoreductase [Micromonospora sp. CPCC 205371]|nr:NAD(P)-dependent oxidoreductase [Micromonospora sp. CPCC 205371]